MEKYFTPSIEDIRVGYECELYIRRYENDKLVKEGWEPTTLFSGSVRFILERMLLHEVRVPYLSKEQIEAEGWKQDERYDDKMHFYKNEVYLSLHIIYHKEEVIYHKISIFNEDGVIFKGECKDINTFRWICKLARV